MTLALSFALYGIVAVLDTVVGMRLAQVVTWGGFRKSLPRHRKALGYLLMALLVQQFEASGVSLACAQAQYCMQFGAASYWQRLALLPVWWSLLDNLRALGWIPAEGPIGRRVPPGKEPPTA
jgi:hypothetical protein